jgi:putative FmdB family regulatory protein
MPIYTYSCSKHGMFDEYKTVSERQTAYCPFCGEKSYQIVALFSFNFKGEVSSRVKSALGKGVGEDTKDWKWDSKQLEKVM